jgi:hypothetical protein
MSGQRLKLLIIMVKTYLKHFSIGKYRKLAIFENAHSFFYHSMHLSAQKFIGVPHPRATEKKSRNSNEELSILR